MMSDEEVDRRARIDQLPVVFWKGLMNNPYFRSYAELWARSNKSVEEFYVGALLVLLDIHDRQNKVIEDLLKNRPLVMEWPFPHQNEP